VSARLLASARFSNKIVDRNQNHDKKRRKMRFAKRSSRVLPSACLA
jgi:hypothetical protein